LSRSLGCGAVSASFCLPRRSFFASIQAQSMRGAERYRS
jgi:hypothetical protein